MKGDTARMTGELQRVRLNFPLRFGTIFVGDGKPNCPLSQIERCLKAVGDARSIGRIDGDAIDDDFEFIATALGQFRSFVDSRCLSVNTNADETASLKIGEEAVVKNDVAAAFAFNRSENECLRPFRHGHYSFHDLIECLRRHRAIAFRAVHRRQPSHQDTEIVVNLRHRADGRARRMTELALFERNRRSQAFDFVNDRLGHLADKLPSIGTEAFGVASLTFGVDRIEGE